MIYIARRMQQRPNRVQTAVEFALRADARQHHARQHGRPDGREVVPVHRGDVPVHLVLEPDRLHPAADQHASDKIDIFGVSVPSFALYAATANLSIPLVLALSSSSPTRVEGIRRQGRRSATSKSLIPAGVHGADGADHLPLEVLSNLMRLISLSVRLFANILAGHLIILFMAGGLAILLGIAALGVFTLPLGVRDLPLRGRPGRHAAGVHLRHSLRHLPRRRGRRMPLEGVQHSAAHREHGPQLHLRRRRTTAERPARRSRSASAAASAPSAPASASASSSAR